ncbi:hypothetical protein [Nocardia asiatica]|uniref:hypothetical protein n=1 Tax=Nocardia asiatica TaxID=209252 RepID=UPI00030AC80B|nr:hypothetical protein [Nocardia asiatica]
MTEQFDVEGMSQNMAQKINAVIWHGIERLSDTDRAERIAEGDGTRTHFDGDDVVFTWGHHVDGTPKFLYRIERAKLLDESVTVEDLHLLDDIPDDPSALG